MWAKAHDALSTGVGRDRMKVPGMTGASKAALAAYVIGGLSAGLAAWFGAALIWTGEASRHGAPHHSADVTEMSAAPAPRLPPVICGTSRCRRVDSSFSLRGNP